jgi:hypothetical protein
MFALWRFQKVNHVLTQLLIHKQRHTRSYPNCIFIDYLHIQRIPRPLLFFTTIKPKPTMMQIENIIKKAEHIKTAIESVEVLVNEYSDPVLKPIVTYLQELRIKAAKELADEKTLFQTEVVSEEISRLSHI